MLGKRAPSRVYPACKTFACSIADARTDGRDGGKSQEMLRDYWDPQSIASL